MNNAHSFPLRILIVVILICARAAGAEAVIGVEDTFIITVTRSVSKDNHRQLALFLGSDRLVILENSQAKWNLNLGKRAINEMVAVVQEYLASAKTSEEADAGLTFAVSCRFENRDKIILISQREYNKNDEVVRVFDLIDKIESLAKIEHGELSRIAVKICTESQLPTHKKL